jgi:predicted ATPase
MACSCRLEHAPRLVVVTGGPGAGKTAVLEVVRRHFCEHVRVLPEAASIVFGGGFPRSEEPPLRCAAQRAVFHVQRELERAALEMDRVAVILCDRGTIDGLAYWPTDEAAFWSGVGADRDAEKARYAAVIHLRTPPAGNGYDRTNPLRIESAAEAAAVDARLERAWAGHPRRVFVESTQDFLVKIASTLARIRDEVPPCCRAERLTTSDATPWRSP